MARSDCTALHRFKGAPLLPAVLRAMQGCAVSIAPPPGSNPRRIRSPPRWPAAWLRLAAAEEPQRAGVEVRGVLRREVQKTESREPRPSASFGTKPTQPPTRPEGAG